jgi:DNA repair exonuclease SbcCD ATPase subunit
MEQNILSLFNKLFISLQKQNIRSFEDLSNPKILYEIGLEIDKEAFSQIDSTSISGEDNLSIRISELNEICETFLNIPKPPEFIPTKKFKDEIELIDIIGLANKEQKNIYNFSILIIICLFYCEKHEYFTSLINKLEKVDQEFVYDLVGTYAISSKRKDDKNDGDMNKINNSSNKTENIDYLKKIEILEKELKIEKEKEQKLKIVENEYNNIKDKFLSIESKYSRLINEINEVKNKNKKLEKLIDEKNKKIGILQNKLDEKIRIIKERDQQLNKEIEMGMELNTKISELNNNIKNKTDYESKYNEELAINDELKNENLKLNDLISIMEDKLNEKNNEEMENDMNNIRMIEELEKKMKKTEKEKEDIKNHFNKEFELMASAIYNLGFQFWSLKYEDSQKLKQNENWLVRERIKQYNGDY